MYSSRWAATPSPGVEKSMMEGLDAEDNKENLGSPHARMAFKHEAKEGTDSVESTQSEAESRTDEQEVEATLPPLEQPAEAHESEAEVQQTRLQPAPVESARYEVQRFRKRVSWRSKACTICIPQIDLTEHGIPMPLSPAEVQARLQHFEDAGYDTRGFDLPQGKNETHEPVHARAIYPEEDGYKKHDPSRRPVVSLPDLRKWSEYMDRLTEAKLAALGVSVGLDEPGPGSAPDMLRQTSNQYPSLPFSPPIPTGSANSMARPPIVRGHSHTMSMAPAISPLNGPYGHMHRHSTFHGLPAFMHQQSQMSPMDVQQRPQFPFPGMANFPQSQQFVPGQSPRVGSPAHMSALRNDLGIVRGPGSPLGQVPQTTPDYSRNIIEDQRRRQHGYSQSVQHPAMSNMIPMQRTTLGPSPLLPELQEDEEEENDEIADALAAHVPPAQRAQLHEDIAVPKPRHRHNISEGLEREVLEAEQRRDADRFEASSYGTNALNGSLQASQPLMPKVQPAIQGHKKTASRFNVAAPAFTYNPGAAFKPTAPPFTFGGQPKEQGPAQNNGHSRQKSSGNLNVAAPAFQPSNVAPMPNTDFNFSANLPAFKPDAPVFEPRQTVEHNVVDDLPTIFGKVTIPETGRPAKQSRDISIDRSVEEAEDENGRPVRSDERQKRQRAFGAADGDEVAQFAEPTPMPDLSSQPGGNGSADVLSTGHAPRSAQLNGHPTARESHAREAIAETASKAIDGVLRVLQRDSSSTTNGIETSKPAFPGHRSSLSSLSALAKPFNPTMAASASGKHTQKGSVDEDDMSMGDLEDGEILDDDREESIEDDNASFGDLDHDGRPHHEYRDSIESSENLSDESEGPQEFYIPPQETVPSVDPSFDEIDAVMRQLNGEEASDIMKQEPTVSPLPSPGLLAQDLLKHIPEWPRSEGPSPSPHRLHQNHPAPNDSSFTVHDRTDSGEQRGMNSWPSVTRLNKTEDAPMSDWSGILSPPEADKLQQRSVFFDDHIDQIIGRVFERRLQPLENSLRDLQQNVANRSRSGDRPALKQRSSSVMESDADDEDDIVETLRQRPISRGRDQKLGQIKAIVLEALREQSPLREQSSYDIVDLHSALADMKVSFARAASANLELEDIRAVVEDVLYRQSQAVVPIALAEENIDSHGRRVSELEGRLTDTLAGALEEANHRHQVEEREAETRRMLRLAEEELMLLREENRDDDGRVRALEEERRELLERLDLSEELQQKTAAQLANLEAENEAMQATLEEYRLSSTKWRHEIDAHKLERERLEDTVAALEQQAEETQESGSGMRRRLERLHADMATAAGQLMSEKTLWKAKEEEQRSRNEALEASNAKLTDEKAQLEEEVRMLRNVAQGATESKQAVENLRASNTSLEELVRKLQGDLVEQQGMAARFEREVYEVRESARAEVHRTRMSLETEVEAAKQQTLLVRAGLEVELTRLGGELENAKIEADTAKERYSHMLEEEGNIRREALRKVNLSSSVALDEARQKYEGSVKDLTTQHSRALAYAIEDKERSEYFLKERLALSEAKLQHFQDKVSHLEERVEIAKSAAQAAAVNAQSSKTIPTTTNANRAPEKVSPQALRESILVLQEQLQEREARIEQLQGKVSEAPAKLKERDTEITWLRELLAVRSEELNDLVNTLARPVFDREVVRDTAIRIRANLQMERQEKERLIPGSSQALASISSFATPKATQLTSAFNKWRTSMESSALKSKAPSSSRARSYTPSRGPNINKPAAGYTLTGLMTPPASNLRSTPILETTPSLKPPRLHSRNGATPQDSQLDGDSAGQNKHSDEDPIEAPSTPELSTPQLFRESSYDQDAEDNDTHLSRFGDDDLDVPDSEPPAFRSLEAELEPAVDEQS